MLSNITEGACHSCPHLGKCHRRKWSKLVSKKKRQWTEKALLQRVTGCSDHPDQEKFLGHSTNVVVYNDALLSMARSNTTSFSALHAENNDATASASNLGKSGCASTADAGGTYYIFRTAEVFDTGDIPDDATILSADMGIYVTAQGDYNYDLHVVPGDGPYPSDLPVVADYRANRIAWGGSIGKFTSPTLNQYNEAALMTDWIVKTGLSKYYLVTNDDYTDSNYPPTPANDSRWNWDGSVNLPYLDITYETVEVPGAIDDLALTPGWDAINLVKMTLDWTAPDDGGGTISNYKIYRSESSGTEIYIGETGDDSTSYIDADLDEDTTYYYYVTAENEIGEGPASNEEYAETFGLPGAPTLLETTGYRDGEIDLSWTAPSDTGGGITQYKIYRSLTSGADTFLDGTGSDATTWTDDSSSPDPPVNGTTYYYKVGAVSDFGDGPLSNEISTYCSTTPGPPRTLAAVLSSQKCPLTWLAPLSNGGATITGYDVYMATTGEYALIAEDVVGLAYEKTGLTNGTAYHFKVQAKNRDGKGTFSSVYDYTPATVPTAIADLDTVAGRTYIDLSWTAPATGGAAITGYKIYRSTSPGASTLITTVTGLSYRDDDTALVKDTTYYYRVKATNAAGDSAYSNEASDTLIETTSLSGFTEWFSDNIYIENVSGYNNSGEPTFGSPTLIECRIELVDTMVSAPSGEVIMSKTRIFVDGSVTVNPLDRVTLEDDEKRIILNVKTNNTPGGSPVLKVIYT